MEKKECIKCETIFSKPSRTGKINWDKRKFCSRKCFYVSLVGRIHPVPRGENNPNWKGDKAGYSALHAWIVNLKGKAKDSVCTLFGDTCSGRLEWSNISEKYHREISDWRVLCATHHRYLDGNIDKLLKVGYQTRFQKGQIPWNKK